MNGDDCHALHDVLGHVAGRWTLKVVGLLGTGTLRFNEIRRGLGDVSQRMLTLTLRGLERDGLVERRIHPGRPPAVDYALTPRGRSLQEPLAALADWARAYREPIERSRVDFDERRDPR